jgi:hypothetical protein
MDLTWAKLTEAPSKLAQIKLGKLYLFGFNLSKFRLNLSRAFLIALKIP